MLDEGNRRRWWRGTSSCRSRCLAARVKRARAHRDGGRSGLTTGERVKLAKLRKENRQLQMERDLWRRKVAGFIAKESE